MRWWAVGLLLFKNKQKLLGIFKSEIQVLSIVSILCIILIQQIYKCLQCGKNYFRR